jgi:polyisoprenoid-binding protein YceI
MRLIPLAALAAVAVATPIVAQAPTTPPGAPDPSRVAAGSYKVETNHTQVLFQVDHLGFNPFYGTFSDVTGTLTLDPKQPTRAALDVQIPIASVHTTSDKLNEELRSPQFFDAAKFPTMRFRSTAIEVRETMARVTGDLTLHGVTKPVTMEVRFFGAGKGMRGMGDQVGFEGRARLKRSDYGVTAAIPFVSDEVTVIITAAFEKTG